MEKKHEQVKLMRNMEFTQIGSNDLVLNAAAMRLVNRYLMKRNKRLSNRYLSLSISNLKLGREINNL
jgi:signal transduction protein with GAF and PtsI domain